MSLIVLFFVLASLLCFIILTAIKAWRYSRYPIHSRLELYPVPKEGKSRATYGGSYFEEYEWWSKPREVNKANETKDILLEMLFIRKLFENQRSLWWASYLFHIGIYAMFVWTVVLLLATIWPVSPLILGASVVGVIGFALSTVGAVLLLIRRIFTTTLRNYTTAQEYFNLFLILFALVTGIISWLFFASPFDTAASLLSLSNQPLSALVCVHLIALSVMFVYIPLSKMSHYVGKFFAFHKVLWDNDPNHQGNTVNKQLKESASRTAQSSWQAPHVNPDDPTE